MKKYTTFLFDFDGTLADSRINIASSVNAALEAHHLNPVDQELVFPLIGKKNLEATFLHFYSELDAALVNDLVTYFRTYQKSHFKKQVTIFPEIIETLNKLHDSGASLAILTTKHIDTIRFALKEIGIDKLFTVVYGDGLPYGKKPEASCVEYILSQLGGLIEKNDVVMVGDSSVDCTVAMNAGIDMIGVPHGTDSEDILREHGALHVLSSFSELLLFNSKS